LSCRAGEVYELADERAGAVGLEVCGDLRSSGEEVALAELLEFTPTVLSPLKLQGVELVQHAIEARLWAVRAAREQANLSVLAGEDSDDEGGLGVWETAQQDRLVADIRHARESS
jgi:hypothetical protein